MFEVVKSIFFFIVGAFVVYVVVVFLAVLYRNLYPGESFSVVNISQNIIDSVRGIFTIDLTGVGRGSYNYYRSPGYVSPNKDNLYFNSKSYGQGQYQNGNQYSTGGSFIQKTGLSLIIPSRYVYGSTRDYQNGNFPANEEAYFRATNYKNYYNSQPVYQKRCVIGGCSGQLCLDANSPDLASTCEYNPKYACFQGATCEVNVQGACAWRLDARLNACLNGR